MLSSAVQKVLTYRIDVETKVDGAVSNSLANTADDFADAVVIDVVCRNQLEPDFCVVCQVLCVLRMYIAISIRSLTRYSDIVAET